MSATKAGPVRPAPDDEPLDELERVAEHTRRLLEGGVEDVRQQYLGTIDDLRLVLHRMGDEARKEGVKAPESEMIERGCELEVRPVQLEMPRALWYQIDGIVERLARGGDREEAMRVVMSESVLWHLLRYPGIQAAVVTLTGGIIGMSMPAGADEHEAAHDGE